MEQTRDGRLRFIKERCLVSRVFAYLERIHPAEGAACTAAPSTFFRDQLANIWRRRLTSFMFNRAPVQNLLQNRMGLNRAFMLAVLDCSL
jgi:hypothetical protein